MVFPLLTRIDPVIHCSPSEITLPYPLRESFEDGRRPPSVFAEKDRRPKILFDSIKLIDCIRTVREEGLAIFSLLFSIAGTINGAALFVIKSLILLCLRSYRVVVYYVI